ncbi:MAG: hypothetical protein FJ102_15475, partial [Deltaproteobacteria bacterium]|nr:hypothetical protein [Deltaproteobacteria bacterium]
APEGTVVDATDCDDAAAAVNPAATEVCNAIDDDCDGLVDNDAADAATWYGDGDSDGYGDDSRLEYACEAPPGSVAGGGDCDDTDAAYNPGATESCTDTEDYNCDGSIGYADADGDGWAACDECDDSDAAVNPTGTELCDDVDNDCDGSIDEADAADAASWYADADADGYGNAASSTLSCDPVAGSVADSTDCDDAVDTVNPGATESCNGVDDDCDGTVDDGATDATSWYTDADGDGYGDETSTTLACDAPSGSTATGGDCNDADADYHPGAFEDCTDTEDYNCDGSVGDADNDGDGYTACEDCDDTDAASYPGADETCDGVDNDCDGTVDESAIDPLTWYADADGDGFGNATSTATACDAPTGYVADSSDCDDSRDDVSPAGIEVCNNVDDDCDGTIDEGDAADALTWYSDADGDGYGFTPSTTTACSQPSGYAAAHGDCDDGDAAYNPGATESCTDTEDYNCDGSVGYVDADGDGWAACEECDDSDAAVNPGASEVCNDVDDDCDGSIDIGATDASTWYTDADSDAYGDDASATLACDMPAGTSAVGGDCDESDASINPGATEVCDGIDQDCDGIDQDCDGTADDGLGSSTWYADADGDTYGDASTSYTGCAQPTGYVSDSDDCDDTDAAVNPAAIETCNAVDDDCNGLVDDGGVCSDCEVEYYGSDDVPYLFCHGDRRAWSRAALECAGYGYTIVTIDDDAENSWVTNTADSYESGRWWIGLSDRDTEGTFAWFSGASVSYTNWASGEPNDPGGQADCVAFGRTAVETWSDEQCHAARPFVCEGG